MKPFLLLQARPEDAAAADEYAAFRRYGDLPTERLHTIRVEQAGVPDDLDLDDYAGVLIGGSPWNVSDEPAKKSAAQVSAEEGMAALLGDIVARDLPFLGSCYGLGVLVQAQGGLVSRRYPEPVAATRIEVTDAGAADPLLAGLPRAFDAFTGHKESCETLPRSAILLATAPACPVQMVRIGANVYATQFHAELDPDGLATRIDVYRNAGYFAPDEADDLLAAARSATVDVPPRILRAFVRRYG